MANLVVLEQAVDQVNLKVAEVGQGVPWEAVVSRVSRWEEGEEVSWEFLRVVEVGLIVLEEVEVSLVALEVEVGLTVLEGVEVG